MKSFQAFLYRGNDDLGVLAQVNVSAYTDIVDYVRTTNQATSSISINSDGTVTLSAFGSGTTWHNTPAAGLGSSYWVIVNLTSGTLTSGTAGARLSLATGQAWSVTTEGASDLRTKNVAGTIEIWDSASGGTMLGSGTFNIDAKMEANRSASSGGSGGGDRRDPLLGQPLQRY